MLKKISIILTIIIIITKLIDNHLINEIIIYNNLVDEINLNSKENYLTKLAIKDAIEQSLLEFDYEQKKALITNILLKGQIYIIVLYLIFKFLS
jgi:hypothetical protein